MTHRMQSDSQTLIKRAPHSRDVLQKFPVFMTGLNSCLLNMRLKYLDRGSSRLSQPYFKVNNPPRDLLRPLLQFGRYLPVLLLLGLGVHFFLPMIASLESSARVLKSMVLGLVVLAFLMEAISYLGSGYMLAAFVAIGKLRLSAGRGALIVLGSNSIGLVAGGMVSAGAATYRWLNQHGSEREWAAIAGILPPTFITAVIAGISVFGLIQLFVLEQLTRLMMIGFGLSMLPSLGLVIIILLGSAYRPRVEKYVEWMGSTWAKLWKHSFDPTHTRQSISDFYYAWEMLRGGKWKRPLLGAMVYCGCDMLALYFLFLAVGHPISFAVLLTGYGLPYLFGRAAFILPGGVGIVESSMAAIYTSLGVPGALSVVVVLAYRLISFWLPSLMGFLPILFLQRPRKQPVVK